MEEIIIKAIETAYNMTKDTVNPDAHVSAKWDAAEIDKVFNAHYAAVIKAITDNPPPSPKAMRRGTNVN